LTGKNHIPHLEGKTQDTARKQVTAKETHAPFSVCNIFSHILYFSIIVNLPCTLIASAQGKKHRHEKAAFSFSYNQGDIALAEVQACLKAVDNQRFNSFFFLCRA